MTLGKRHKEESRALLNKIKEDVIVADRKTVCWVSADSGNSSQRIIGIERLEEKSHVNKFKISRMGNPL